MGGTSLTLTSLRPQAITWVRLFHQSSLKKSRVVHLLMTDLLPEHLGSGTMDDKGKLKQKHKQITSITEWLKSFAVYDVAVIANKQPKRIPDLMEYQILILEAYTEYKNDCWLSYDQKFHQRAACLPHISWSTIDSTLWNLAFAGQAKSDRCTDIVPYL